MLMYLYFQHNNETVSLVSQNATEENAFKLINADVEKRNPKFKVYYIRCWKIKGHEIFDVGSHTEYYILTDILYKNGEKPLI